MSQITGAIIGITLVLMAVFVPMAFFPGSVGIIYRQFSVTMVSAIAFSALLALSLTPALCATLLKPVEAGHGHARKGVFGWFNRVLRVTRNGYTRTVERVAEAHRALDADLRRAADRPRLGVRAAARRLPAGRRPGLYHHRRADAVGLLLCPHRRPRSSGREISARSSPGVENVTFLTGFSFLGQGVNTAQAFISLKDWSERGKKDSAAAIVADINRDLSSIRDAKISALQPPPIDNLGNSSASRSACRTAARRAIGAGRRLATS